MKPFGAPIEKARDARTMASLSQGVVRLEVLVCRVEAKMRTSLESIQTIAARAGHAALDLNQRAGWRRLQNGRAIGHAAEEPRDGSYDGKACPSLGSASPDGPCVSHIDEETGMPGRTKLLLTSLVTLALGGFLVFAASTRDAARKLRKVRRIPGARRRRQTARARLHRLSRRRDSMPTRLRRSTGLAC